VEGDNGGTRIWTMDTRILLSRYRLVDVVRRRGLATTYRAVDEQDDKAVAVKLVPVPPGSSNHLAREFGIGSRLSHRNLVRYHDCFQMEDHAGLVTQLVEGEPFLAAIGRSEPNTLGVRALSAFRQLAHTIAYLHDKGLVHANLSPSVVLWTPLAELKLIDLGHCEELSTGTTPWAVAFYGTPLYSSPEHGRGPLVVESDYFVVGLLLVEHLTGANPFHGGSVPEVLCRIHTIDTPQFSLPRPPLPEELRDVVGSLLSAAPVGRRAGWRDLVSLLEASEP
jgi:eukaryotic-like serine/threonine-protein kinase